MPAKVILNPYAARWKALERRPEAEKALKSAEIDYELVVSESPGHGIELASQALWDGFNPIIAAGGDSTFNEVINGLMQAAGDAPLVTFGILPMGTANDLADNLGIPKELDAAARVIAEGKTRMMDVCQVNDRFFINNSAAGLEPTVTVIQESMKRFHGVLRYLIAALRAVMRNPQWVMDLEWDGGDFQGPVALVSVGNNPRTGGIFYTVPHADPFDGKLSFVYGYVPTRGQILRLLLKLTKPDEGNYIEHPDVHEVHCTWLRVHTEPATPAHSDGELFEKSCQDLFYQIHPGRVPILLREI